MADTPPIRPGMPGQPGPGQSGIPRSGGQPPIRPQQGQSGQGPGRGSQSSGPSPRSTGSPSQSAQGPRPSGQPSQSPQGPRPSNGSQPGSRPSQGSRPSGQSPRPTQGSQSGSRPAGQSPGSPRPGSSSPSSSPSPSPSSGGGAGGSGASSGGSGASSGAEKLGNAADKADKLAQGGTSGPSIPQGLPGGNAQGFHTAGAGVNSAEGKAATAKEDASNAMNNAAAGGVDAVKAGTKAASGNVIGAASDGAKAAIKLTKAKKQAASAGKKTLSGEADGKPPSEFGSDLDGTTGSPSGGGDDDLRGNASKAVGVGAATAGASAAPAAAGAAVAQATQAAMSMLMQALTSVGNFVVGLATSAISAVGAAAGAVVSTIGAVGAAVGSAIVAGGVAFASIFGFHAVDTADRIVREDGLFQDPCAQDRAADAANKDEGSDKSPDTDVKKKQTETAKHIYYVLKSWGADNDVIAALLGNFSHESGIDSYAVESIIGERYEYGPKKKAALEANFDVNVFNPAYAKAQPGVAAAKYAGIGLAQWTGPRNTALRAFAKKTDTDFRDVDTQLSFLISKAETSKGEMIRSVLNRKAPFDKMTMEELTSYVTWHWEVPPPAYADVPERVAAGKQWEEQMDSWGDPPEEIKKKAADLMSLAGSSIKGGEEAKSEETKSQCHRGVTDVSNGSIALAAVTLAAPNEQMVTGNDGTYWYKEVHDKISDDAHMNYHHYADCGHFVKTAVAWSGTDDRIASQGATWDLDTYFRTSKDWEVVAETISESGGKSIVRPGDVLQYKSIDKNGKLVYTHITLFVGEKAIDEVWSKAGNEEMRKKIPAHSEIAEASLDDRGPGLRAWSPGYDDTATLYRYVGEKHEKGRWTDFKPKDDHKMWDVSTTFHHS